MAGGASLGTVRPLLLAGSEAAYNRVNLASLGEDIEVAHVTALPGSTSLDPMRPSVLLVDAALAGSVPDPSRRFAELSRLAAVVVRGGPGESGPCFHLPAGTLSAFLAADAPDDLVLATLQGALGRAQSLVDARVSRLESERQHRDLLHLAEVGVLLATERDHSRLLEHILAQARQLTCCDAATLYLVERNSEGYAESLRVKLTQNHSIPQLAFNEFTLPLDSTSLAGHVASTGEALSIPDVAAIRDTLPYSANRAIDALTGYQTKSMLVLPLVSHRDETVGVLQLINRKRHADALLLDPEAVAREVVPFSLDVFEPASALAAYAAVSIENGQLYESIELLLEGFVTAAVEAIDARDPGTAGHSIRVAELAVALAEALSSEDVGPYAQTTFNPSELRELRYAALLHDFGKVAVREAVLLKKCKLRPRDLQRLRHQIELLINAELTHYERERCSWLLKHGTDGFAERDDQLRAECNDRRGRLASFLEQIHHINSGVVPESTDELHTLLHSCFTDGAGVEHQLLTDEDREQLSIPRGTLDTTERLELESHVEHTDRFLRRIPWTRELAGVVEIAYGHHEKLNGVGYPRGVKGDQISLRTRLITIADVFDALTANDRAYRGAMATEAALDILHSEAQAGELDAELVRVFRERCVWERSVLSRQERALSAGSAVPVTAQ